MGIGNDGMTELTSGFRQKGDLEGEWRTRQGWFRTYTMNAIQYYQGAGRCCGPDTIRPVDETLAKAKQSAPPKALTETFILAMLYFY
jgi:hypothetical protein